MRHGCRLPADGARDARSMMSRTVLSATGVGRKARQEKRVATASNTSINSSAIFPFVPAQAGAGMNGVAESARKRAIVPSAGALFLANNLRHFLDAPSAEIGG